MPTELKSIYLTFMQDPGFESNSEKAWIAAWNRYRQTKRNEEALNLVKHEIEKFHTHSKYGKLFKPITYNVNKQLYSLPINENTPNPPVMPNTDYELNPGKREHKELKYNYNNKQPLNTDIPPKTALERLEKLLNGEGE